jgi:acetyl esterase/lipase
MRKLFVFFLTSLAFVCHAQDYSQKWTDVNYAGDANAYHLLDIYLPIVEKTEYPVVIYIYGSAWYSNNGKGAEMNTIGSALLDAGYAVVTPNYRASSDTLFPAQIHDIKAVIRYIRANCEQFKIDTSFIGISGSSSGGHLAALAGTTGSVQEYTVDSITMDIQGKLGNFTSFSSKVDAVCDWFGPTDLLVIDSCRGSSFGEPGSTPEEVLIGETKAEFTSKFVLANPITYVNSNTPPFLIFHGDADVVVPYCESELLHNALLASGVESEFILMPGGQHYTGVHTSENISKMVDFFNQISENQKISGVKKNTANEVKVYPNPSKNMITLHGNENEGYSKIEIYDLSGKTIILEQLVNNQISIVNLDKGVYIAKIYNLNGNVFLSKIIKE